MKCAVAEKYSYPSQEMTGNTSAFAGYPNKSHWKFRGRRDIKNQLKKFLPRSIKLGRKKISNLSEIETFYMLVGFLYTSSCTVIKKYFILPISLYVPVISGDINGKRKQYSIGKIVRQKLIRNNKQHFVILMTTISRIKL